MQVILDIVEANIFDEEKIRNLFKKADICINLVGILFEKKRQIHLKIFIYFSIIT